MARTMGGDLDHRGGEDREAPSAGAVRVVTRPGARLPLASGVALQLAGVGEDDGSAVQADGPHLAHPG